MALSVDKFCCATAKADGELFRTVVNVVASVSNMDCLDVERCVLVGLTLPRRDEFVDEWRECWNDGFGRLVREWMDDELSSGCFEEKGGDDDGWIGILTIVGSVRGDFWGIFDVNGIKCVNDDVWWLGEDNDDECFLFEVGEMVISRRSSSGIGECPCSNGFVDEKRIMSLSAVELHTL